MLLFWWTNLIQNSQGYLLPITLSSSVSQIDFISVTSSSCLLFISSCVFLLQFSISMSFHSLYPLLSPFIPTPSIHFFSYPSFPLTPSASSPPHLLFTLSLSITAIPILFISSHPIYFHSLSIHFFSLLLFHLTLFTSFFMVEFFIFTWLC